jgi:hypothetical protein
MKKENRTAAHDELRSEYDLSKLQHGVRGKYHRRYKAGTNLVRLEPDVAKSFPDDESVNAALRSLIGIARARVKTVS